VEPREVFVLALCGTSPAVVTELLWYLAEVERVRVVGLEIWTTSDEVRTAGLRLLGERARWFHDLAAAVSKPDLLPDFPAEFRRAGLDPTGPPTGVRIQVPVDERGLPLPDIESDAHAQTYAAALHDRVRCLRGVLPPNVELIGGLSGGRKTMSAALTTAFLLQARAPARLLHILVHPDIEGNEKEFKAFAYPNEELNARLKVPIKVEQQVRAHEVPFVSVRQLVARQRKLMTDLDTADYRILATWLQDAAHGDLRVRLNHWNDRLHLFRGETEVKVLKVHSAGRILRALLALGGEATCDEISAELQRRNEAPVSEDSVRVAMARLAARFHRAPETKPFAIFVPRHAQERWSISAHDRFEVF
jgi:CRISPR-associated protein (TIGR02584 family)